MKWLKTQFLGKGSYGTVSLAIPSSVTPHPSDQFLLSHVPSVIAVKTSDFYQSASLKTECKICNENVKLKVITGLEKPESFTIVSLLPQTQNTARSSGRRIFANIAVNWRQCEEEYLSGLRRTTAFWGWFFLLFGSIFFVGFFHAAILSKLLPPSNNPFLSAIQQDRYYCFLVPLTLPIVVVAVYFHWLSMKMFKHA